MIDNKLNTSKTIVFFDDHCYLCSNSVRFLLKADRGKKLLFSGISNPKYEIPETFSDSDSIIVYKNAQWFDRSKAVEEILKSLGGVFVLFRIFAFIPKKWKDRLYDKTARNRYIWFGRRNFCNSESSKYKDRFI